MGGSNGSGDGDCGGAAVSIAVSAVIVIAVVQRCTLRCQLLILGVYLNCRKHQGIIAPRVPDRATHAIAAAVSGGMTTTPISLSLRATRALSCLEPNATAFGSQS